jgi:acyl-CoA hydrolase
MIPLEETYIENRVLVQPDDANHRNIAHGGNVVKWMDEVGAMSAMRFAGRTCVTARMESVDFLRPIPRGNTALVESYVYDAGTTSMDLFLRVFSEDPMSGDRELTSESRFVYVALDDEGDPAPVPDLDASSDRARELRAAAVEPEVEADE